jgi:hypothetical protein
MDEPRDIRTPETEDTYNPQNPPNSLLRRDTRQRALMSYLGPVILLFVVAGIALIYWANRGPAAPDRDDREQDAVGTVGGGSKEGGFNPAPEFGTTRDELKFRGENTSGATEHEAGGRQAASSAGGTLTSVASVANSHDAGARVEIHAAQVASINGNTVWIRDGDTRIAVVTADGAANVKPGGLVNVWGETEVDAGEGARVRASRIEPARAGT